MMNTLLYYLFIVFYFFVKYTPKPIKKPILYFFYLFVWNFDFFRKKVVLKNLEIAFPEKTEKERIQIAKQFYKNFIFYISDIIETMNTPKEELEQNIEIKGKEYLESALKEGKPVVFMTAHFGNWELAPKIIGAFYTPIAILMREFENKKLGEFFKKSRNSFNNFTINKRSSAREIIKAVKNGYSIGILIDQHSTADKAEKITFFNQEVTFNRAISTLAKKFKMTIVPVFTYKENEKHIIEFLEPQKIGDKSIHEFTEWQGKVIEEMIKKHPSEYYWFHKRFKLTTKY